MSAPDAHAAIQDEPQAPLAAEVVTEQPSAQSEPPGTGLERANAVIDAAANAAAAMPGVPGRDEFLGLAMQARMLSMSAAAPKAVRNNPALAFHVAMVGRDLGVSPSAALELIDVIETKRNSGEFQLSLSPQLLNAQVRRLGLGEIIPGSRSTVRAVAVVVGPRGLDPRCRRLPFRDDGRFDHVADCTCDILGDSEFSWEDAREAGLVGKNCQPGDHKRNSEGRCGCNSGYQSYPKRMLWWRAGGFAADDYFPEAGLGLYSPEELGAVVDENGRPIDPATVELPPGYEQRQVGRGSRGAGQADGDPGPVADATKLRDLRVRILSLPDALKGELKQKWAGSNLAGYTAAALPESKYGLANSMLLGFEARARAMEGWDQAKARQEAAATIAAQEAAQQSAAGKTAGQAGGQDKMSEETEGEPSGTQTTTADAAASTPPAPTGGASPAGPTSPPPAPSPDAAGAAPPASEPGPPPTAASSAPSPDGGSTATAPPTPAGGTTLGFDPDVKAVVDAAPPEVAKATLDRVNALSPPRVGEELARLGQPLAGATKERRRRLVAAYLLEAGIKPHGAAQAADSASPVVGTADAPAGPPAPS